MENVAVLLTCFNRKNITVSCLETFFQSLSYLNNFNFDFYLVDDGSTDGTSDLVKSKFPDILIIEGTGDLYWNQGMRLAWITAFNSFDYDFYLWLNDDTFVDTKGLYKVFNDYYEALSIYHKPVLVCGACKNSFDDNKFSYGGRNNSGPVLPNGFIQNCTYINGNFVLVPRIIFNDIGFLSNKFLHGFGDYDYGLRAILNGYNCVTTKDFVATCSSHIKIPSWCDYKVPFYLRWKSFNSPTGLNINDYIKFKRDWSRFRWPLDIFKAYLKLLFPRFYGLFK